ncbi:Crp/Fnr family transcriptional regulator [Colwellia sp. MEBiC06753]
MLVVPNLHNWRKDLSEEALSELKKMVQLKKYAKDQFIYVSREESHSGFQIVSGRVDICTYSEDGDQLILSTLNPGDCFGDLSLLTKERRVNSAVASEDTLLNVLTNEQLESLIQSFPEILLAMNTMLCNRFRMVSEMLEDAYLLPLYKRLAKVLVRLVFSQGIKEKNGDMTVCNVSQETLGLMVGATRQSVARELKKMENDGMLSVKYNKLTIPDLNKMIEQFDLIIPKDSLVASYPKEQK